MKLFMIEPEVAGELGENTIYENYDDVVNEGERAKISHLHFVFYGWLGDDILETTPCFLVSEKLKETIEKSDLSGYEFENIEVTLSEEFLEIYPDVIVPSFYRLLPKGTIKVEDDKYSDWDNMDFSVTEKDYLVVSEKVMDLLKNFQIENADITELHQY